MQGSKLRHLTVAALGGIVLSTALAAAQQIYVGGGRGYAARFAEFDDFDGQFLYCRAFFSDRNGRSGGWTTDYPGADNNFSIRLAELTRIPVKFDANRQPHHVVVHVDDPVLYRCPMLFIENVERLHFSESEVASLRDYLKKGGFLWVDDFWGSAAWANWAREFSRVLPSGEYPIFDVPISHPIMHTVYDVDRFLQVSNINFWYQTGGRVSERGYDSAEVHYRAVQDSRGRLMAFMTHNTDIGDTWEREGDNREFFNLFSPRGYAIGVNVVVYALTH
jgi:hypothetical protein